MLVENKSNRRSGDLRRLTTLIYADWVPQTNGIVGSLPLFWFARIAQVVTLQVHIDDSPYRRALPDSVRPIHPITITPRCCGRYAVLPTIAPQMNPASSRATAVAATCGGRPAWENRQYFLCSRLPARSAYWTNSTGRLARSFMAPGFLR